MEHRLTLLRRLQEECDDLEAVRKAVSNGGITIRDAISKHFGDGSTTLRMHAKGRGDFTQEQLAATADWSNDEDPRVGLVVVNLTKGLGSKSAGRLLTSHIERYRGIGEALDTLQEVQDVEKAEDVKPGKLSLMKLTVIRTNISEIWAALQMI